MAFDIEILRGGVVQATVDIDENTVFTSRLMGEHKIEADFVVSAPLPIDIGDYIVHNNESYYINTAPTVEKLHNFSYRYVITFEGEVYYLYNKIFLDEGDADFSYHGTPEDFLLLLLLNINSIQPGWTIAGVDIAEPKTISFNGDNCRTALTKIAEEFGMEYRTVGKAIYLQFSVGFQTTLTFEYGRGKGLYQLTRTAIDEKNIVTRVYGYGSRRNLDQDYRNGASRLQFQSLSLDNNVEVYGVREGTVTFEEVFPSYTGTLTADSDQDILVIEDTGIPFNINDQLIEGVTPKVVFKTGFLAGYEFEIKRYLNGDKKIEILPFTEDNGYTLPNGVNYPLTGNQYTLVGIKMPQTYIDAAEAILQQKTQDYLDENSVPRVSYDLFIDERYVRANGIALKVGDIVQILDSSLGVDNTIRVTEVTYPLVNKDKITATISESVPYTIEERILADSIDNGNLIIDVDRRREEETRRATARFRNLQDLIFDPDGYFDSTNIKPASVETLMLSVGAKSQSFGLSGVQIRPNNNGNANALAITAGQLIHYEISIAGLGYVWQVDPLSVINLDAATAYFIYAKCSKTALSGVWELSTTPRPAEDEPGHYLFNLGILYPVVDGRRDFDLTKGMTFITGDTITTGTIQSLDGLNFFNLSEGKWKVGNSTSGMDWNVSQANKLTIRGGLIQTPAGDNLLIPGWRGLFDGSGNTTYYNGDVVSFNGQSYIHIGPTPSSTTSPDDNQYWEVFVQRGSDGADGTDGADGANGLNGLNGADGPGIVFRGNHSDQVLYYNNTLRRDVVKYNSQYYIYKGPNAVSAVWAASNWDSFGAQFTSVATDLLLAESANIADWIIKSGKISSQAEYNGQPRMQLDGVDGKIIMKSGKSIYTPTGGIETLEQTLEVDGMAGQIKAEHSASTSQSGGTSLLTSEGVFANFAGQQGLPASSGVEVKGAIVGLGFGKLDKTAYLNNNAIVGVFGRASNSSVNPAPAFGGYFMGLMAAGLYHNSKILGPTDTFYEIQDTITFVACYNSSQATVYLPVNAQKDRVIYVKRIDASVVVSGNGEELFTTQLQNQETINTKGFCWRFHWDGTYWHANYMQA